jgi:metallo-beta-lactamase family protein
MKLQFWGATETVTGSMHLVEANGQRILLDCGTFQGKRQEARERNERLPFDVKAIDAVVLSHAHIDHSGNLPTLVKAGYRGSIFSTSATRDLCSAMLRDSAAIQESDARFVNKLNAEKGLPPVEPLYTVQDALDTLKLFHTVEYDRPSDVLPGVRLTFRDAGHILGSASVALEVKENSHTTWLAFTGDVGRKGAAILRDPQAIERADVLLTESTYGGRHHGPMDATSDKLAQVVRETFKRGGLLIIPAFAVGRTQDIVYHLHRLFESNAPCRAGVRGQSVGDERDRDLSIAPECYDEETHQHMLHDHHKEPFGFTRLVYVRDAEDSKALNDRKAGDHHGASGCAKPDACCITRHHLATPHDGALCGLPGAERWGASWSKAKSASAFWRRVRRERAHRDD